MEDWISTFESMLFGGVDLGREPLDGSMQTAGGTVSYKSNSPDTCPKISEWGGLEKWGHRDPVGHV